MATIPVTVEVAKEVYELQEGLVAVTKAVVEALKDGWQPGTDLPALVTALLALAPAVDGIDQVDDEWKEDPAAVARVAGLLGAEILALVLAKPAELPPAA